MTVDELILRLRGLNHGDWEIHLQESEDAIIRAKGIDLIVTNMGVRTEIFFGNPVRDSSGRVIPGRYSSGYQKF